MMLRAITFIAALNILFLSPGVGGAYEQNCQKHARDKCQTANLMGMIGKGKGIIPRRNPRGYALHDTDLGGDTGYPSFQACISREENLCNQSNAFLRDQ